jgi:integrase
MNGLKWDKLGDISVGEALERWLSTHSPLTEKNYRSGIRQLIQRGYLKPTISLQEFTYVNSNAIIDRIKKDELPGEEIWSECTRQARAACFISFTRYLDRRSGGMIRRAQPSREGSDKTFYRVRLDEVETEHMTQSQWTAFLDALAEINSRDCLIAKLALQGGKRINEVLKLTTDRIYWEKSMILFAQSKTRGAKKDIAITYPKTVMDGLKAYIGDRTGLVFVTRTGKKIATDQVENTFAKAGDAANIPFKVTPHVLRATLVTYLLQQGFPVSEIRKITGHASSEMVLAYDKSAKEDNPSKKVCLVQ